MRGVTAGMRTVGSHSARLMVLGVLLLLPLTTQVQSKDSELRSKQGAQKTEKTLEEVRKELVQAKVRVRVEDEKSPRSELAHVVYIQDRIQDKDYSKSKEVIAKLKKLNPASKQVQVFE